MAELATLGIEAKTTGVDQASTKLDKLTGAAKRAEAAVEGIGPSSSKAGAMASQAANSTATALNAEAVAATKAAGAMRIHSQAANQNTAGLVKTHNTANLAAQGFDIVTTAAGGMSAGLIGMQQGLQIAQVAMTTTDGFAKTLGASFLAMLSPVTLLAVALTTLAAVGIQSVEWTKLAASALVMLADSLEAVAPYAVGAAAALALLYAPAIIGGIISVIAMLGRLAVAAVTAGAAMLAANPVGALVLGFTVAIAAANIFRDELSQIFGRDIVADAKNGANFIIGAFVGGFNAIKATWSALPGAIGDAVYMTVNATISGVEMMINKVISMMNSFIGGVYSSIGGLASKIGVDIGSFSGMSEISLGNVANPYAGQAAAVAGQAGAAVSSAMGTDYVGGFGEAISRGASAASAKLKELAKDLTTVDEKSKGGKGAKAGGGKTAAEQYSDIVEGANRRIASLQAEQQGLGMTEQAAAALRYEQDLLNQAQQKGIELTAAQKEELHGLAGRMAATEAATKGAKEALDMAKDATGGFLSDLRSGLRNGEGLWQSFGKAALNVVDKITDKIQNQLVDALFSASSAGSAGTGGGGGIFGSILGGIGKIFGFASGGYTGSGAANKAAGIVHGGEFVFSKKATDRIGVGRLSAMHNVAKGYAGGGSVTPVMPAANQNTGGQMTVKTISEVRNGNLVPVMTEVAGSVSGQQIKDAAPAIVQQANRQVVPTMAGYQSNKAGADYRG